MKQFLLSLIVLVAISEAKAQTSGLVFNENFNSYSNGNLQGQGTWSVTSGSTKVQVASSTPLTYTGYPFGGSKYANITAASNADDPYKNFTSSLTSSTSTYFYMSFLVRVGSSSNTTSTGSASPVLSLRTSTGDNLGYFFLADASGKLKLGISKTGNAGDGVYASAGYNFNTTYLIVIRYEMIPGGFFGNNDNMYMWVNPSLSSEPSTASADATSTWLQSDNGYTGNVNGVQFEQTSSGAAASFDALRIAYAKGFSTTTANTAAAWDALNPANTPLPVKFGDINASIQNKGVQVSWNVYAEENVVKYVIERSSDGISFADAGSVTAKGLDGKLDYNWFDATPASGNNYYRIRNVDIDGKFSYSPVVKVSLSNVAATEALTVYPNPATGNHISLQASTLDKGDYRINIYSMSGQQVYSKQFTHAGGPINQSIEIPGVLQRGIYNIQLAGAVTKMTKQFLVQ